MKMKHLLSGKRMMKSGSMAKISVKNALNLNWSWTNPVLKPKFRPPLW